MSEREKVYTVRCCGVKLKNFKTRKEAEELKAAIEDEPSLFLGIQEWDAGVFYPWVQFDDDKDQ